MKTLHDAARAHLHAQDRKRTAPQQGPQPRPQPKKRPAPTMRAVKVKQPARRAKPRKRRSNVLHYALHALGAVGALGAALAFNLAAFPEAVAQERPFLISALHVTPLEQPAEIAPQLAAIPDPDPAAVHLLAATTWAEARSEGEEGMRAVAHVIVNRIGHRFGDDLSTVILSPKQFSSWNLHDPNRPLAQNPERYATAGANAETWQTAQQVALQVLKGQSKDPTDGALFYHTAAIHPWWARFGIGVHRIGAHVFYANVPDHRVRGA